MIPIFSIRLIIFLTNFHPYPTQEPTKKSLKRERHDIVLICWSGLRLFLVCSFVGICWFFAFFLQVSSYQADSQPHSLIKLNLFIFATAYLPIQRALNSPLLEISIFFTSGWTDNWPDWTFTSCRYTTSWRTRERREYNVKIF